ncbi:helix-turn-helix domain-containing protein [bacterium]|nr:helix-turn-helix domain-containing protein [bacterium]
MDNIEDYIKIFKALSNPHRLKIFFDCLDHLKAGEESINLAEAACKCQRTKAEELGIVPSTISHHLKELSNAGLIDMRRDGQRVVSRLNKRGILVLSLFLRKLEN